MNWNFLITFGICLGAYFVILGVVVLVKYIKHKKSLEKEIKEYVEDGQEEVQKQDSNNQTTDI